MPLNVPIILTWLRIAMIPLIVGLFYLPSSGFSMPMRDSMAALAFIIAALTDWFDGWLARRWNQTSAFGAFLDPVADKLMVCAALLVLLDINRVDVFIALVIIGRELTISALREWMATLGARASVAVHRLGKFKAAAQMIAIPCLLYDRKLYGVDLGWLGGWLIIIAAVLISFVLHRFVQGQIDQRLDAQILFLASQVTVDGHGDLKLAGAADGPPFDRARRGWYWEVNGPNNSLRSRSLDGADLTPPDTWTPITQLTTQWNDCLPTTNILEICKGIRSVRALFQANYDKYSAIFATRRKRARRIRLPR